MRPQNPFGLEELLSIIPWIVPSTPFEQLGPGFFSKLFSCSDQGYCLTNLSGIFKFKQILYTKWFLVVVLNWSFYKMLHCQTPPPPPKAYSWHFPCNSSCEWGVWWERHSQRWGFHWFSQAKRVWCWLCLVKTMTKVAEAVYGLSRYVQF